MIEIINSEVVGFAEQRRNGRPIRRNYHLEDGTAIETDIDAKGSPTLVRIFAEDRRELAVSPVRAIEYLTSLVDCFLADGKRVRLFGIFATGPDGELPVKRIEVLVPEEKKTGGGC